MALKLKRAIELAESRMAEASATLRRLERLINYHDDFSQSMEYDAEVDSLEYRLEQVFIAVMLVIDLAQLPILSEQFLLWSKKERASFRKYEHNPYSPEDISSPALYKFLTVIETIREASDVADEETAYKRIVLNSLLDNIPNLLFDRGVAPNSEKQVKDGVFDILKAAFPDMEKEVSISKPTKVYKMDMASRELAAGIEFKFATSEAALKAEIGGVYEDMKGYDGNEDYSQFYGVFCVTGPFIHPSRIYSEPAFRQETHWKPILCQVIGGDLTPKPVPKAKKSSPSK